MTFRCLAGLVWLFIASFVSPAFAAEVIHSFDSEIEVRKSGDLIITETIVVTAEGRKIRRGIYRDFPTLQENADGQQVEVGFDLISVSRDGKPDKSRVVDQANGVRIYIGDENVFLERGKRYTYEIKYKTNRQIRFFDTHDELFWNVTGNFWVFPIEQASGTFILPQGANFTDTIGYTGKVGSRDQNVSIETVENFVNAQTTRSLATYEGLSVAIKMPKGTINPPSDAQLSAWWWKDNINIILASFGLIFVTAYYFTAWWMVGRDPPSGVIVPRWDAPDGMSPALINYIDNKGLSGKGFDAISSAVLSLAVKGYVTIDKLSDTLTISLIDATKRAELPIGEQAILNTLVLEHDQTLQISKSNGKTVKGLQQKFAKAMEKEHRDKYYKHNILSVIGGVFLSIVMLGGMILVGNFSEDVLGLLFIGGMITVFVSVFGFHFAKQFASSQNLIGKITSVVFTGFAVFSAISSALTTAINMFFSADASRETWLLVTVIGIIVLNVMFYFLLGAPTKLGRSRMDGIEGLKTYLTLAEEDRMNMREAPDFSEKHYEELLPYAVALGVEKPWSQTFEVWLAAAVAAGSIAAAAYRPNWYSGSNFNSGSLSDTMSDFTGSMQNGFSDAMPVPKSSSSGFSGGGGSGGGGGGGGGGW